MLKRCTFCKAFRHTHDIGCDNCKKIKDNNIRIYITNDVVQLRMKKLQEVLISTDKSVDGILVGICNGCDTTKILHSTFYVKDYCEICFKKLIKDGTKI